MIVPNSQSGQTLARRVAALRDLGGGAPRRFLTVLAVFRRTPRRETQSFPQVSESTRETPFKNGENGENGRDAANSVFFEGEGVSGFVDSGLKCRCHRHLPSPQRVDGCGLGGWERATPIARHDLIEPSEWRAPSKTQLAQLALPRY